VQAETAPGSVIPRIKGYFLPAEQLICADYLSYLGRCI